MNDSIKSAIKNAGLKQWQIADKLGISESGFCRKLRYQLPKKTEEEIFEAIKTINAEKKNNNL